ncbi:MAG: 4Fe-4S dicluster domain-containing protein [Candidatus Bathyarchaeia archaeon]
MVNPNLLSEIKKFGAFDISACFNCGNCTATCPLSKEGEEFPRKMIRYATVGLENNLLSSPEPWSCYYCGDCTTTCPRDADPAAFMMALRRYLTTRYDWTGLSSRLYRSKKVELLAITVMAWITGLFIYFFHGPIVLNRTELLTFAPLNVVETGGLAIFAILAFLLSMNIFRMYRFIMNAGGTKKTRTSMRTYLVELVKTLPIHFFTQRKMEDCSDGSSDRKYWVYHLMFFGGYVTSFILFMLLLKYTLTNMPFLLFNPLSIVGIAATTALLFASAVTIYGRIKKTRPVWKYSHPTDWMFILLLVLTVATGIFTGVFRYIGIPLATYLTFSIHLMVVVPFLILEVPFAKWSHLAYRPFATYFARLREIQHV